MIKLFLLTLATLTCSQAFSKNAIHLNVGDEVAFSSFISTNDDMDIKIKNTQQAYWDKTRVVKGKGLVPIKLVGLGLIFEFDHLEAKLLGLPAAELLNAFEAIEKQFFRECHEALRQADFEKIEQTLVRAQSLGLKTFKRVIEREFKRNDAYQSILEKIEIKEDLVQAGLDKPKRTLRWIIYEGDIDIFIDTSGEIPLVTRWLL